MIRRSMVPKRGDVCLVFAFEVAAVRWSHAVSDFQVPLIVVAPLCEI
jgi:hypothetical protein